MEPSMIYISVTIAALAVIAILVFAFRRHHGANRLSPLAGLAFAFVLSGMFTGDDPLIGYSLFGIGIVLAVLDIVRKRRLHHATQPTED
jgi:hypothetical protein